MTQIEQTKAFSEELDRLCDRFAREFDLTYNSMVGALEFKKAEIVRDAFEIEEE